MSQKWTSYRARFQGELGGVKTSDLTGLDYDIEKFKERLDFIVKKIDKVEPFFNEYFFTKEKDDYDNGEFDHLEHDPRLYFNYSPNTTDELSIDINICKFIEQYGSYLLNSKNLQREKQQEYTILSEDDFKKFLGKEMSSSTGGDSTVVMDTRPSNDYNNLTLKITKKDLNPRMQTNTYGIRPKDLYLAEVLNAYETIKEHLKVELRKIQLGEPALYDLLKIRKLLADINDDMLMCKNQILGIRAQAKRLGDESPTNDFSMLDYKKPDHIKAIMKTCKMTTPRPDDICSHMGYDLLKAVSKLKKAKKIDDIDMEIIECYNSGNYTIRDIAMEIDRVPNVITQRLDKICRRISEVI